MKRLASPPARHPFAIPLLLSALMSGSYLMCMVIALSCYPGFTIAQNYISDGGSPYANPDGWLVWMAGHLLNGIFMGLLLHVDSKRMGGLQPRGIRNPRGAFKRA